MRTCPQCQRTYPDDAAFCLNDGTPLLAPPGVTEAQLASSLARRYRIVEKLGAGGMGVAFLAEQIALGNRPVALKVLSRKLLDDPEFLLRFHNEGTSTARIRHPNVVTIYESGQADDGTPYIAMEYLEGESLRHRLHTRGALPVAECAEILQQVARGLNAAHKLGIIHRDLKPDNIFLTHGDEGELIVKVVDFGIAKLRESTTHTVTGQLLGTPAYMSCEQASGMRSDELDARSDIYSLGVVTYEMLTGRVPFHSDTPQGYVLKHVLEAPPPFRAAAPGLSVPRQVEAVVMKALAKGREQRYGSILEFARAFAEAAKPEPAAITAVRDLSRSDREPPPHDRGTALQLPAAPGTLPRGVPAPSAGTVRENPRDGLKYVWIPPGTFMMGCSPGDSECVDNERPLHQVTITKGFWIAQTPVTAGAYKRFAGATGWQMLTAPEFNRGWANENMPIVNISWDHAHAYCAWLGGRLLTEAEWEYAARGGKTEARYGHIDDIAWYDNNSGNQTHEVAQKRPNSFGLYDMLGNVWEWVNDWYDENYYQSSPLQDPQGPASGQWRVVRGGSWNGYPRAVRVSGRLCVKPSDWNHGLGFRCGGEMDIP